MIRILFSNLIGVAFAGCLAYTCYRHDDRHACILKDEGVVVSKVSTSVVDMGLQTLSSALNVSKPETGSFGDFATAQLGCDPIQDSSLVLRFCKFPLARAEHLNGPGGVTAEVWIGVVPKSFYDTWAAKGLSALGWLCLVFSIVLLWMPVGRHNDSQPWHIL